MGLAQGKRRGELEKFEYGKCLQRMHQFIKLLRKADVLITKRIRGKTKEKSKQTDM